MRSIQSRPLLISVLLSVSLLIPAVPARAAGLSYDEARHLLIRTEFAAPHERVLSFEGLSRREAARRILRGARTQPSTPLPDWFDGFGVRPERDLTDRLLKKRDRQQRRRMQREQFREYGKELLAWWWTEILTTDSPFTERMTIFWHNHFATAVKKVRRPDYMLKQNITLRRHALGKFDDMLHAVAKDPAMIFYLDNQTNRKGAPNENFAREVMELFTVGEGHYTEQDIKEAARAFTGWTVDRRYGTFVKRERQHDDGEKKVLGRRGTFDGEDILEMLLARDETAAFITTKLWREFISPDPDPKEVERLATVFRRSNYDIAALMQAILTSDAFYDPRNRTALIKSPVDFIAGTLRQFHIRPDDMERVTNICRSMGQDLFNPPNVKGWPGGTNWINSNTLTLRQQFTNRIFRAREMPARKKDYVMNPGDKPRRSRAAGSVLNLEEWINQFPGPMPRQRELIARNLISDLYLEEFRNDIRDPALKPNEFLQRVVKSPYYELK